MNGRLPVRFAILIAAEVFFCAALNFSDDWTVPQMPVRFVGTAFAAGIAFLAAVSHFPPKLGLRRQAAIFWGVAILLRLVALPLTPSDELFRYQWDGKVQRAGLNPYLIAPSDSQLDGLRRDFPEAVKINHPEMPAAEAPGAEVLFRFLSGISDRPLFYKIIFAIGDLSIAALLLRLLGGDECFRAAAWYAWNPLAVYSFAGAAHFDSLMILALVGGIIALTKASPDPQPNELTSFADPSSRWVWAVVAAACFGIAISLNIVAASLLLLFIFALRWRAFVLALSLIIPTVLSLPFGFPQVRVWHPLGQINYLSRLNDLFWWLIEDTFWPNPHQRSFHYVPIIIVCVAVVSLLFIRDWRRGMLWALAVVLVLSPIFDPWYCTWILPLAAWRRAYGWQVLSITIFAYYLFWDEDRFVLAWHAEPWMRALIICPVLAALVMLAGQKKGMAEAT